MIRLTPTPESTRTLTEFFERLERAANPTDQDLAPVAQVIRDGFARNFDEERSAAGHWAALAPRTVIERRRLGFGPEHPILVRTGEYAATWLDPDHPDHVGEIWRTGRGFLRISEGSMDERAEYLEEGTAIMPARPVAPLQAPDLALLDEALGDLFDRIFGAVDDA